jgi:hypothetical protein
MRVDRFSKVTDVLCGKPQRTNARSSMVNASLSTFHDHRATPAASMAWRRCFAAQAGGMEDFDATTTLPISGR